MPRFIATPPVYEAREFSGGSVSALDIQGWLLANGIESNHVGDGQENEKIVSHVANVEKGQWLMFDGTNWSVISASELYRNYTQVP